MNGSPKIDPARLTPAQLAAMLSRSGEQQYTEADIEADIKAGAMARLLLFHVLNKGGTMIAARPTPRQTA